jgi:hypothetical protein
LTSITPCGPCSLRSYGDCRETCNQLINLGVFNETFQGQVILNAEWLRKLYRTVKWLKKLCPHASRDQILENAVLAQITALPNLPSGTAVETVVDLTALTVARIRHDTPRSHAESGWAQPRK